MAITCIPYQPIDFCNQQFCFDEEFCLRVQTSDTSMIQFGLSPTGSELVQNGDFAASTGWNFGTGWTYDGTADEADASAVAGGGFLDQDLSINDNHLYKIVIEVKNYAGGRLRGYLGGEDFTATAGPNANGTYTFYAVAGSINNKIQLTGETGQNFTGSIDNVSVFAMSYPIANIIDCETQEVLQSNVGSVDFRYGEDAIPGAMLTIDWDDIGEVTVPNCIAICIIDYEAEECTFVSQCICLATTHPGTVLFTATNEDNFIVDQTFIDFDFFQQVMSFRCEARVWHPHPEESLLNYQFSNFNRETTHFENVTVWDLITEELPYPQHFGLWAMMGMDHFYIDGVEHSRFGDQTDPDWIKGTDYTAFESQVVKNGAGMMNANC